MGLLDRLEKIAKNAYNYVLGESEAKSAASKSSSSKSKNTNTIKNSQKKYPNSVVVQNTNTGNMSDEVVITPKNNNTQAKTAKKYVSKGDIEVKNKINHIKKLCQKYNIKKEDVLNIFLPSMGLTKENFDKMDNLDKGIALNAIESVINTYYYEENKDNIDINEVLAANAKCAYEIEKLGAFKSFKEFKRDVEKSFSDLQEGLKSAKTPEEKEEIFVQKGIDIQKRFNNQKELALSKCKNNKERQAVEERYNAIAANYIEKMILSYMESNPAGDFTPAVLLSDGDNYDEATKLVINCSKDKPAAAKNITPIVRHRHAKLKAMYMDKITKEAWGNSARNVAAYLTFEDAQEFLKQSNEYRQMYQNNPDEFKYLTEEYFTAESIGIGVGVTLSKTMSVEEQAEFMYTWDQAAQQFDDYDAVRQGYHTEVKQYLDEHPEAKQGIEDLKTRYREEYGNPDLPKAADKRYKSISENQILNNISEQAAGTVENQSVQEVKTDKINDVKPTEEVKSKNSVEKSVKDIAKSIKSGDVTIVDAINQFHEKAYDAIFEDPELFIKNRAIAKLHVNNYRKDLQKLLSLSNFSGAIELIVQNISPTIKDEYAHQIKLSGITKEAIFGKEEKEDAAA